ncbi:hypothetical protein AX15_007386 [Amanita polypyramis BW_CC]|nr:hypothetical protein AX15_007386 [Amanita polypyramis BW_CC]
MSSNDPVEQLRDAAADPPRSVSQARPISASPLHRAGLLQPNPYATNVDPSDTHVCARIPHSQGTIRESSIRLSNMPILPPRPTISPTSLPPRTSSLLPSSSSLMGSPAPLSHTLKHDPPTPGASNTMPVGDIDNNHSLLNTTKKLRSRLALTGRDGKMTEWEESTPEELEATRTLNERKKLSALSLLRPEYEQLPPSPSGSMATTRPRNVDVDEATSTPTPLYMARQRPETPTATENKIRYHQGTGTDDEAAHERVREGDQDSKVDDSSGHSPRSMALTSPTLPPSPAVNFQNRTCGKVESDDDGSGSCIESEGPCDGPGALGVRQSCSRRDSTQLVEPPTDRSPLLFKSKSTNAHQIAYDGTPLPSGSSQPSSVVVRHMYESVNKIKDKFAKPSLARPLYDIGMTALRATPAVLLGCLLNILDGVSYGMIIFPSTGVFSGLGPMGVSMFFASCIVSQLVYALGGSGFAYANGSMMIEVIPFFHVMANSIANQIGEDHPREIIATTLVVYALSSILTGLVFLLLGALKLGAIVGFFPRHILIGCIGGVGVFLIITGLTVSLGMPDGSFQEAPLESIRHMFGGLHTIMLWLLPLALAVLLRLITYRCHHQLIFPLYFVVIPLLFYIIIFAAGLSLDDLRKEGWLFDMGMDGVHEAWYKMYSYLDPGAVHLGPIWTTLPTQFALLFFNILHPPLNVPALSVSLNEDVDTNRELVGHGYSNLLAGLIGTVPNYLVYINTLLFYRVGGNSRIAGFMLALATTFLLFIGTGPVAYIPVMVVGALIFVLGIDLVKEALWDTRHRTSKTEYLTIVSIMVCMAVWDFVIGVLFGIIASCVFFVVQSSQRKSIRIIQTGETAMSSVRRPSLQREYIREVSKQTTIIKLQGFLFFGTITQVEEAIRSLIDTPSWKHRPIRFLVLDLSLVAGVDMSAAEASVRIHHLLYNKVITLVFCGFQADSSVGKALSSVGVLGASGVELFSTLNDAMEWTENEYLHAWYRLQKVERATTYNIPRHKQAEVDLYVSLVHSPRHQQLDDAARRTLATESESPEHDYTEEPFIALRKVFSTFSNVDYHEFYPLKPYLERLALSLGHVLWRQGDSPDGLYIVESGVLRATYEFAEHTQNMEETMCAGTLAGELSALSDLPRNATVTVEQPTVLWKLSTESLCRLRREKPDLAATFTHLVLKSAKIDYDILLGALASRQ